MSTIGQIEKKAQERVVKLFRERKSETSPRTLRN